MTDCEQGCPSWGGAIKTFWNSTEVVVVSALNAIELYSFKRFMLYYVNFTSTNKKSYMDEKCPPLQIHLAGGDGGGGWRRGEGLQSREQHRAC